MCDRPIQSASEDGGSRTEKGAGATAARPSLSPSSTFQSPSSSAAGFTLLEILIVVVILGILATFVIPQFSNASLTARENTLKDELRYLRTQIIVYKAQHSDRAPGDTGIEADFIAQMTGHTNEAGAVSPTATSVFKYGPYLSKMPVNPINGKETIEMSTAPLLDGTGDGSHGWVYNPVTQEFIADLDGTDLSGVRYDSY